MRKVRVGVIGVGHMGSRHARVCFENPLSELVAVVSKDEAEARRVAESYRAKAYTDYGEMLSKENLDAVFVATPDHLHREPVVTAAEAGVHIFCEKPLASNLEDADAIISAAKKAGVKLMVGYILRFDPRYAAIKDAIEEGTLGEPLTVYSRRMASKVGASRLEWKAYPELYLAVHDIDLALWYVGDTAIRVSGEAVKAGLHREKGIPDAVWVFIRFKKGAVAVVEAGWMLTERLVSWRKPSTWKPFGDVQLEVIGSRGSAYLNYTPMCLKALDDDGWKFPETLHWPELHGRLIGSIVQEHEHFYRVILEDGEPLIDGEEARRSLEIALAARRSAESGTPVELPISQT